MNRDTQFQTLLIYLVAVFAIFLAFTSCGPNANHPTVELPDSVCLCGHTTYYRPLKIECVPCDPASTPTAAPSAPPTAPTP